MLFRAKKLDRFTNRVEGDGRKEKSLMTHPQSSAELKGLGDEEESAKKTEEN